MQTSSKFQLPRNTKVKINDEKIKIGDFFESAERVVEEIGNDNYVKHLTKEYKTDPFRQDVLIEYDFMETGPDGKENIVPSGADDLLKNPFYLSITKELVAYDYTSIILKIKEKILTLKF